MFTGAFLHEAIINGAETAERMGDFAASRDFLKRLDYIGSLDKFKDRVEALEAKLTSHLTAN